MNTHRLFTLAFVLGLAVVAGCGKEKQAANNDPAAQNKPGDKPKGSDNANSPEVLIVGRWETKEKSDKPIDWGFIDPKLKEAPVQVSIRDGAIVAQATPEGEKSVVLYKFADGGLEVSTEDGPKKLKVKVTADALVLTDDKGNTHAFKRVPPVVGDIKITGLPVCCGGCTIAAKKQLEAVPGASDVNVDLKAKTATLKLKDGENYEAVRRALHKAGMTGKLFVNGKDPWAGMSVGRAITVPQEKVVLKGVHACCPSCEENLAGLFKKEGYKISLSGGDAATKTLTLTGKQLDSFGIQEKLAEAGYYSEQ